mmetsp:Transcript_112917/g.364495  ORF Transcript_112917/g.364495 Transcript_112917/m.364495 type:complete len:260 (+) Transcript_112917:239-1018(+)
MGNVMGDAPHRLHECSASAPMVRSIALGKRRLANACQRLARFSNGTTVIRNSESPFQTITRFMYSKATCLCAAGSMCTSRMPNSLSLKLQKRPCRRKMMKFTAVQTAWTAASRDATFRRYQRAAPRAHRWGAATRPVASPSGAASSSASARPRRRTASHGSNALRARRASFWPRRNGAGATAPPSARACRRFCSWQPGVGASIQMLYLQISACNSASSSGCKRSNAAVRQREMSVNCCRNNELISESSRPASSWFTRKV